ncbi:rhomboid family protein [Aegicerativicinus sediminis]|uniref:rhomboid family protein n=1 Tax=Aegicerativicinus sediminis TaxID=2893202 RepID=UPI001E589532|nr:rhomboid family intramembrane serine protease [Aegicerativicinus sediminis]
MTSLQQDLKAKLNNLNPLETIILVNLAVFVLAFFLRAFGLSWLRWFELPKDFFAYIKQPWSIISYGFLHYGFFHLLFNMLVLYYLSRITMNLFKTKMTLNIYFLGIIFGGLSFLFIYNVLPEGSLRAVNSLIGASAGVRALLIFICAYMPQTEMRFFTFNIKLYYIGIAVVLIDLLGLFSANQGGYIAHLGGSLLGYMYAVQLQRGNDIGKGFERLMDSIATLFKRKAHLKTVHKSGKRKYAGKDKQEFNQFTKQKRIDLILDKISKSGYESLTKEEKEFLFKAGKE